MNIAHSEHIIGTLPNKRRAKFETKEAQKDREIESSLSSVQKKKESQNHEKYQWKKKGFHKSVQRW